MTSFFNLFVKVVNAQLLKRIRIQFLKSFKIKNTNEISNVAQQTK